MWLSSFSHDYSFIVSGSEDKYVYIWSTYHDLSKFTSVRRDRNDFWEAIKGSSVLCRTLTSVRKRSLTTSLTFLLAHNAVVTSAIFAPHPSLIVPQETGTEKPDAECKSLDSTDSETIPSGKFALTHSSTITTSLLSFQCLKMSSPFSGALKTDHTEVLLSADFTGAIKVFINVKKYWTLEIQLVSFSFFFGDQSSGWNTSSSNYLMGNALRAVVAVWWQPGLWYCRWGNAENCAKQDKVWFPVYLIFYL